MTSQSAKFSVGQLVIHKLFGYRGVIYDADPCFMGTDEWYTRVARSRPPKNAPWYKVLIHNGVHETYVAERNLETDDSHDPIHHPMVEVCFDEFKHGRYYTSRASN